MFKNYIWDFDGMLFDSYPHITKAFQMMMEERGIGVDYAEAKSLFEISFETCYAHYGVTEEMARRHSEFEHIYDMEPAAVPFENTLKTLEELNRSGAKQFLFSHRGHESSQHYLGAYGLLDYFTECVDSSYGFTPKPAPDGVLYLLGKYGLNKDETLMVGDRELDVMAGKNAGTYGCLFTKEKNVETNADFVVSDIGEIPGLDGGIK
ncbi:MAG: HAD-IA family hydrolase [Clostridia bacterium]|nr:HAD-IA family hydrolase [Clostridia bacterium]